MSGDTGFYSAAEKLGAVLERRGNYTVEVIPGISSVGYFFAKIRRPWDHAKLFSMHGQAANFALELKRSGSAFILGGGAVSMKRSADSSSILECRKQSSLREKI